MHAVVPFGDSDTKTSQTSQKLLTDAWLRPTCGRAGSQSIHIVHKISDASTPSKRPKTVCCWFLVSLQCSWYSVAFQRFPGKLLSDNPELITNSSFLHEKRRWTSGDSSDGRENEIDAVFGQPECPKSAGHQATSGTHVPSLRHGCSMAQHEGRRHPEVKRRVTEVPVQAQPQVREGISYPPGLHFPHETSFALVRDGGGPWSAGQKVEDMSELVQVWLVQEKKRELDLKDPRWQTKEGTHLVEKWSWTRVHGCLSHLRITFSTIERVRPHAAAMPRWIW